MTRLEAALAYAARGWPVFRVGINKRPLTEHGVLDATMDEALINYWLRRWPNGVWAIATGERSGVVALDVDIRDRGSGLDSLEWLGINAHPETPTAHSPSGGLHLLFRWPGRVVKTSAGKIGQFLDVRGDGASLILPPGPGRYWDPYLGLDTLIAEMPEWMVIAEPAAKAVGSPPPTQQQALSKYSEAALDKAVKAIVTAPDGQQRDTLNREVYSIAQLVAGNVMPAELALKSLQWAARQLRTYDSRRPWHPADLDRIVRAAFTDGLARPRQPDRVT